MADDGADHIEGCKDGLGSEESEGREGGLDGAREGWGEEEDGGGVGDYVVEEMGIVVQYYNASSVHA